MTALAPASASISAERSPVWAPDGLGWQSCPPIVRPFEPRAFAANTEMRVAGGHTSRSALPATFSVPASMASNSLIEEFSPFIFQLPAISGRIVGLILRKFLEMAGVQPSLAEVNYLGQIRPPAP